MAYDPHEDARRAAAKAHKWAKWADRFSILQLIVVGVPTAILCLVTLACCGYAAWAVLS